MVFPNYSKIGDLLHLDLKVLSQSPECPPPRIQIQDTPLIAWPPWNFRKSLALLERSTVLNEQLVSLLFHFLSKSQPVNLLPSVPCCQPPPWSV